MTKDDIAKWARESGGLPDPMVFYAGYERFANLVAAAEREACERVIEELLPDADRGDCASAIRARGTT